MKSGYVKYKWIIQIVDTYRQIIFIFSYNYKCFCGFRFHCLVRRRNVSWSHFMILLNVFIGKSLFFDIVKADSHLIAALNFYSFHNQSFHIQFHKALQIAEFIRFSFSQCRCSIRISFSFFVSTFRLRFTPCWILDLKQRIILMIAWQLHKQTNQL